MFIFFPCAVGDPQFGTATWGSPVICPHCHRNNSRVIDSRPVERGRAVRRRRHCDECTHRWSTHERPVSDDGWLARRARREAVLADWAAAIRGSATPDIADDESDDALAGAPALVDAE